MGDFPICPLCEQPVDTNTDAFITEPVFPGITECIVKHHVCPTMKEENE